MATSLTYSLVVDGRLNPINNISTVTATYSANIFDSIIFASFSSAPKTVTLPLAALAGVGKQISVHSGGASSSTVAASSGDNINGSTTLATTTAATYVSDGVKTWFTI